MPSAALLGLGCGPALSDDVAVGRPAAEEAPLVDGRGFHRADDPSLDAAAFALRDAPEDGHHQFVDVGVGVDPAADVWHPQVNAEVLKDGEGVAELGPVERALRLADDHRVEGAAGCGDGVQEPCASGRRRQGRDRL